MSTDELPLFDLIQGLTGASDETSMMQSEDNPLFSCGLTQAPAVHVAPRRELQASTRPCWGSLLSGSVCSPEFCSGTSRFKYQFCSVCQRDGLVIPQDCARLLPAEMVANYQNPTSHGMWSKTSREGANIEYRVINHTAKCRGDALIIVRDASSAHLLDLPLVPPALMDANKKLLMLSRGTPCHPCTVMTMHHLAGSKRGLNSESADANGQAHAGLQVPDAATPVLVTRLCRPTPACLGRLGR